MHTDHARDAHLKPPRCTPLPGVDRRLATSRRFEALVGKLAAELGGNLGEVEMSQVRSAATLQLHAEQLAAKAARGETVDSEELTRAANGAMRAMNALKARKATKPAKGAGLEALKARLGAKAAGTALEAA